MAADPVEDGQGRKIIHVDMDAFFAAIEQRDEPKFRNRPLIVGGNPWARGVVSTCSYEARRYGVHSAMPSRQALDLCPHAIFLAPRMEHYAAVSREIFAVFSEFCHLMEPLSIDEAFLDVTRNPLGEPSATRLAKKLQRRIWEKTRLTASVGVSFNPFLAKVASEVQKPCGLTVIAPERAREFLDALPIRKFYGVGPATADRLEARQIFFGSDLRALSLEALREILGKLGQHLYDAVRGFDPRPIVPHRERQSLGKETTFAEDLSEPQDMGRELQKLAIAVAEALGRENQKGRTITLKLRYANFESISRSVTLAEPTADGEKIFSIVEELLFSRTAVPARRVRLLGVSVSSFQEPARAIRPARWIQEEFPFVRCLAQAQIP